MEAQQISFLDIDSIPKLIKDFLQQQVPESETAFFDWKNAEKSMNQKDTYFSSDKRMLISEVFQKQYEGFTLSEKQQKNIRSIVFLKEGRFYENIYVPNQLSSLAYRENRRSQTRDC